jgi:hypothetical protein
MAFWTLPSALSVLPSACSLASPVALPRRFSNAQTVCGRRSEPCVSGTIPGIGDFQRRHGQLDSCLCAILGRQVFTVAGGLSFRPRSPSAPYLQPSRRCAHRSRSALALRRHRRDSFGSLKGAKVRSSLPRAWAGVTCGQRISVSIAPAAAAPSFLRAGSPSAGDSRAPYEGVWRCRMLSGRRRHPSPRGHWHNP